MQPKPFSPSSTSSKSSPNWGGSRGFTLMEAMVVVAVLAILAAIAVPNMTALLEARRIEGVARQVSADALFARSEAIKRNAPVLMCAGQSGDCEATPAAADWAGGWRICLDRDDNGACDTGTNADPNPIRLQEAQINGQVAGPTSRMRFNADGTMTASATILFTSRSTRLPGTQWAVRLANSGASSIRKESY
jgi:type IV fimbrial biogenesis protein FimT